jgi:phosphoglycerol transferase
MKRLLGWLAQPVFVVVVVWGALGGPSFQFDTPLMFSGDALYFLAQAKATIDHGWWWTNPSLGAPSTLHAVLLPWGGNVDHLLVRITGLAVQNVASVVMISWLAMIATSGMTAAWCFRYLGVSPFGAWISGVLFALLPYVAYHNTTRFNLGIYLIPFAAAGAIRLATDETLHWTWKGVRPLAVGAVVLCFNTVDYAAFGVLVIGMGAVAGAVFHRSDRPLRAGALLLCVMALAMVVVAAPRWSAWEREGEPGGVRNPPMTTDAYGLKIRHLLSPLPDHWFGPLRHWAQMQTEARFPLEVMNSGSRTGVVASAGLLALVTVLMVPSIVRNTPKRETVMAASRLGLASVLFATIGGFGSLLAVFGLVWPGPLALTAPFIAFFALAVLALLVDDVRPQRRSLMWTVVLVLGVSDQIVAFGPLTEHAPGIQREIRALHEVVERLERSRRATVVVFQMPVRPYPREGGVWQMGIYDHFRPYVLSRGARWSYPALSSAQLRWQDSVAQIAPRDLPAQLAREGFTTILIDRAGYEDNAVALIAGLETIPNAAVPIAGNERYIAMDLRFALTPK